MNIDYQFVERELDVGVFGTPGGHLMKYYCFCMKCSVVRTPANKATEFECNHRFTTESPFMFSPATFNECNFNDQPTNCAALS